MIPAVDIATIAEELRSHSGEIIETFEDQDRATDTDPRVLVDALEELFNSLRRLAREDPPGLVQAQALPDENNVQALGDYGIRLLARLAGVAGRLRLPQQARRVEELTLPFACWIARQGGELSNLSPVVNGAAGLANSLKESAELAHLYGLLSEVANAVSPQVSQDTASTDPTRPWRILLLNRAIVATRSHRTALMEEAFESLIEHLPDDAPDFFREGMEQMDALNYPPHVRAVMQRYYAQWSGQRVLH
ncbi:MAG: hypothetical protein U9Q81_10700 [Pseudomonadota bacterium]|nr:hypothetical protein [Pseudomonadota bacterium]